jgi:hypothetical protein
MKRQIVSLLFGVLSIVVFSQNIDKNVPPFTPVINVGVSSGSNNFTSYAGLLAEVHVIKNLTALGGVGIGPWGVKTSVGARYYKEYAKGIYFGLSYSSCAGKNNDTLTLETFMPDTIVNQDVILNLKKAKTVNLSIGYCWRIMKRSRFYLELGYSIPLNQEPYEIVTEGIYLTESGKQNIEGLAPGGFILGWGFIIGF